MEITYQPEKSRFVVWNDKKPPEGTTGSGKVFRWSPEVWRWRTALFVGIVSGTVLPILLAVTTANANWLLILMLTVCFYGGMAGIGADDGKWANYYRTEADALAAATEYMEHVKAQQSIMDELNDG